MPSVRTHLWFGNNDAAEAASFYAEHIPDSAVDSVCSRPAPTPTARSPRSWSSPSPGTR